MLRSGHGVLVEEEFEKLLVSLQKDLDSIFVSVLFFIVQIQKLDAVHLILNFDWLHSLILRSLSWCLIKNELLINISVFRYSKFKLSLGYLTLSTLDFLVFFEFLLLLFHLLLQYLVFSLLFDCLYLKQSLFLYRIFWFLVYPRNQCSLSTL